MLAAFTCASALRATAEEEPIFHRISLEQGLSDGRVTSIVQDKYGFIWIGTAAGLNRYDGYNIRVYEDGESGLEGNSISALYCSKAGTLYVSDAKGLLQYDYAADRFRRPPGTDSAPLNKDRYHITLMNEDAQGRIYLGCTREGFHRYDPRSGRIEDMNALLKAPRISFVSGLTFGPDGRLWVTTQKQGFFSIDLRNNTAREIRQAVYPGIVDTCCPAIHRSVFLDGERLLLGQHSFGLLIYNTRTGEYTRHSGLLGKNDSVRFNAVFRLIKDYRGRVWAGTAYHGLVQYVPATGEEIVYRHDPYNPASYGGYRVQALFEDRDHNIWVGTGGYGVYRFHPDKNGIRYYPWHPMGDRTPPGPEVLCSAAHDSASVWIGTDRGPALFNFRSGIFKAFGYESSYNPQKPGNNITVIYPDQDGTVWMASRFLGISRFDTRKGTFKRYIKMGDAPTEVYGRPLRGELPGNTVRCIAEAPDGTLLLLIQHRIALFDPRTAVCRYYNTDSTHPLLRIPDVSYLRTEAGGSTLVYATEAQDTALVWRYDFRTGNSTKLASLKATPGPSVNQLCPLADGSIAVATSNGLFHVPKNGGAAKRWAWEGPGRRQRITGIAPESETALWLCTDRHLGRLNLRTGEWRWLGPGDGLKPARFYGEALRLLPDGRLLAGSGEGMFVIGTAHIVVDSHELRPPRLGDFRGSGKRLELPTALQEVRKIELSHEQNFFSFVMSALSFGESGDIEYGYKLDGFDQDWQSAGHDRSGQYTGVGGGGYTLLLRARAGSTSPWVVSPQRIRIEVAKPWWGTWAFRIGLLLAAAGIVAGIYFYRVRSIRREARLRSDYEIRLNELETSALRTQMNPHFIFNCLNTINSYINSNQKTEANHYITRFAKLIRLILENSRKRRVALSSDLEALKLYMQLEQIRFENRFSHRIVVPDDIDTDNVEVPPLVLQPFVENAILHGILPADRVGMISVRVVPAGALIHFIIEDNGIGRAEAARRHREGALKKESHGMAITMKRIELFNREEGTTAQVHVEDLADADGKACGTRVVVPLAMVEGF